jgi:hypothetical protein
MQVPRLAMIPIENENIVHAHNAPPRYEAMTPDVR